MPKPRRTKQPDFLQFRPYHAFTAHAERPAKAGGMAKWWLLLLAAAVMLVMAAVWLSQGR
ncbi:MAG TPA: hypothetical protein VK961_16050 [Chthoniobacter sp.]|nr:hypothetical protein [Chthoniobacter sp.]